ncbi:MAG: GYD domain-containing protein [Proteobacteria bacterium]|nr:GYD domain-containing protein [Pseudomonadota bacterium]
MLFCLAGQYTQQALNAMRENPDTDRQAAVAQLVEAAGGKLVSMYGTGVNGPGVMVIFDVPDPDMSLAMTGVAVSAGAVQNVQLIHLFSMEEVSRIRQKRSQLSGAYRPPRQS